MIRALLVLALAFVLTGCVGSGKNYSHQMANGDYLHGTDHNTTYVINKGSRSNREWVCPTEEFSKTECYESGEVIKGENPTWIEQLGGPAAGAYAGHKVGEGLGDSGNSTNVSNGSSAVSSSKARARSSGKKHY